jgi:quercetin dioxygenase-like cupin family protein
MIKNLFIALAFVLMLINPNISIAAESPVDVQEVFVGSETMDGDAIKYPRGKAEIRLQRVELAEGGTVPLHSHPIPLLGNVEKGTIVVRREGMDDITYNEGDSFVVGPKTPKHTMGNAKTDTALVWFAAMGAKDVPILVPAEG